MGIKKYNAYTPSRRHMTGSDFKEITKSTPEKALVVSLDKNAGRNNQGKITVRHRGGGSRRKYRVIDFKRNSKDGIPATAVSYTHLDVYKRQVQNAPYNRRLLRRRRNDPRFAVDQLCKGFNLRRVWHIFRHRQRFRKHSR